MWHLFWIAKPLIPPCQATVIFKWSCFFFFHQAPGSTLFKRTKKSKACYCAYKIFHLFPIIRTEHQDSSIKLEQLMFHKLICLMILGYNCILDIFFNFMLDLSFSLSLNVSYELRFLKLPSLGCIQFHFLFGLISSAVCNSGFACNRGEEE